MADSAIPEEDPTPAEGATNDEANDSDASSSASPRPLSPRLDDKTTIKDVLQTLKRREEAHPMPSTVARNLERRRKRLRGENEESVSAAPTEAPASPSTPAEPVEVMAPQVTIDEEGNIVVDQASLFVEAPRITTDTNAPVVESSADRAHITSASFMKREKSVKWTAIDTKKFYLSLRAFGTDFSTMAKVFPYRSRRQLKTKYKREEREHPDRIDEALNRVKPTTAEELDELFGTQDDNEGETKNRNEASTSEVDAANKDLEGKGDDGSGGGDGDGEAEGEGEGEAEPEAADENRSEVDEEESESDLIQITRRSPSPEV